MFEVDRSSPISLYRAFACAEHAEEFVRHGRVRLGSVYSYKSIADDSRRDPKEGDVLVRVPSNAVETVHLDKATLRLVGSSFAPGVLNFSSTYMHPVYALCMSGPDVDLDFLRTKMGRHVVRITDTARMVDAVATALRVSPLPDREVFFLDLTPITYSKGDLGPKPTNTVKMSFAQKPLEFKPEREHRLAVGLSGSRVGAPTAIFLSLACPQEFCEMLPADE